MEEISTILHLDTKIGRLWYYVFDLKKSPNAAEEEEEERASPAMLGRSPAVDRPIRASSSFPSSVEISPFARYCETAARAGDGRGRGGRRRVRPRAVRRSVRSQLSWRPPSFPMQICLLRGQITMNLFP